MGSGPPSWRRPTPKPPRSQSISRADLHRIARSANDELKLIKRAGLPDLARQADEARVIDEARARAVRRVESTIRHLQLKRVAARDRRTLKAEASTHRPGARVAEAAIETGDLGMTQVIPSSRRRSAVATTRSR